MEQQLYIERLSTDIETIISDYRFNNYRNQLSARKLSAEFRSTYDERYLWNLLLGLISKACIILNSDLENSVAIASLKTSAEIFEDLSYVSDSYDRSYCMLLSSLCYDIAGYQANASCIARNLEEYALGSIDEELELRADNYILRHLKYVLVKNIPKAQTLISRELDFDLGIQFLNSALVSWYRHILQGEESGFEASFAEAYRYYLLANNVHISQLLLLVRTRIRIYSTRSVWNNLRKSDAIRSNPLWEKYIKLLTHDLYERNNIKNIEKRTSKFEFWISQLRAIDERILENNVNYVIQMPTSAGKTFIAELVILNALLSAPGKKCIYVAPFRALSNEKENELSENISKLGFSVSALSGSYEVDEFQHLMLDETDVLIATPEKIDLLLRVNSDFFSNVSLIVIDEGHIVGDISPRASLLEFLIIRLRMSIPGLRTIFISAVMPPANADEYSLWLNGSRQNVIRSILERGGAPEHEWEPTRKVIGRFNWYRRNGRITYLNRDTEDENTRVPSTAFVPSVIRRRQFANQYPDGGNKAQTSASLAIELVKGGSCLIFCAQVADTERVAKAALKILEVLEDNDDLPILFQKNRDKESYFFAQKLFGNLSHITRCLEWGIGIHYGDMPEAVRRSVESDYSNGHLSILICTNTIGQGLNFPIKNLIVHSTIITAVNGRPQTIGVRDFWNIIGRAGRAGKETEGQIIFVINSDYDNRMYGRYTNKRNIEEATSMLFTVLDALIAERISQTTFDDYIKVLTEPYLLSVLAEETIGTSTQELIEQILEKSLFKIQIDERGLDLTPVRTSFSKVVDTIKNDVAEELLPVYAATGFCLHSNGALNSFIKENVGKLSEIVNRDSHQELLSFILTAFSELDIIEMQSEKLDRILHTPIEFYAVALSWISGAEIDELLTDWDKISSNRGHLNILLSDGFYYRYSWGTTAFLVILAYNLGIEVSEFPAAIRNISSFIKYGVDSETACLARSLGIKNRDIALKLADESSNLSGRDFIVWLANLTKDEIDVYQLNQFDSRNILDVAIKLVAKRYSSIPDTFDFAVKGTSYEQRRRIFSRLIKRGDELFYSRDVNNEFDHFAIKILD